MKQASFRIAVASCENLPEWEIDDKPFFNALRRRVEFAVEAWSDRSVDWASYDAVLLRTTWDYTERLDEFLDWVNATSQKTKMLNAREWVIWNCRKTYLRDLADLGVAIAPTHWLTQGNQPTLLSLINESPETKRWFLKPQVGATSSHTLRFSAEQVSGAQAYLDEHIAKHDFILQPYLSRVERDGEYSLLFMGGRFTHGVRKVPVAGDYRVQDDFGAHDEPFEPSEALFKIGHHVIESAKQASGVSVPLIYARLDFLRGDQGEWLLNELEVIEPSLFFRHADHAPEVLCDALLACLQ